MDIYFKNMICFMVRAQEYLKIGLTSLYVAEVINYIPVTRLLSSQKVTYLPFSF